MHRAELSEVYELAQQLCLKLKALLDASEPEPEPPRVESSFEEFGSQLTTRAYNCLYYGFFPAITNVQEILKQSRPQAIKNLGRVTFAEICVALLEQQLITKDELFASQWWQSSPKNWRHIGGIVIRSMAPPAQPPGMMPPPGPVQ